MQLSQRVNFILMPLALSIVQRTTKTEASVWWFGALCPLDCTHLNMYIYCKAYKDTHGLDSFNVLIIYAGTGDDAYHITWKTTVNIG